MTILAKTSLNAIIKDYQLKVSQALSGFLPAEKEMPSQLHQAMLHSLSAPGKRLRPILIFASYQLKPSAMDPLPAAVSVEYFHTGTLVHDDLPAMDDSVLRRGQLTCHRQFDEATAILAGDALMVEAFKVLSKYYSGTPELANALTLELAIATSSAQLMGGQMADILAEREELPTAAQLDYIHRNKTAALIRASLAMGALLAGVSVSQVEIIRFIGERLGLAFQILDDVLDETQETTILGKTAGEDLDNNKLTYPRFYGIEASRQKATELTQEAIDACFKLEGDSQFLRDIALYMLNRQA